jgi:hypothetical protein
VGVSPLIDGGFDEALGLAVCSRSVGPGATVFQAELDAASGEGVGLVTRSVIGEHPLDGDAELSVPGHGSSQEVCRAALGLVRIHGGEG